MMHLCAHTGLSEALSAEQPSTPVPVRRLSSACLLPLYGFPCAFSLHVARQVLLPEQAAAAHNRQ